MRHPLVAASIALWALAAPRAGFAQAAVDGGAAMAEEAADDVDDEETVTDDEEPPADAEPAASDMVDQTADDGATPAIPDVLDADPEAAEVAEERRLESQTIRYELLPPVEHPIEDARREFRPSWRRPDVGVHVHEKLGTGGLSRSLDDARSEAERQAFAAMLKKGWVRPVLPMGPLGPREADIPLADNELVRRWIGFFEGVGAKYMRKWVARYWRYGPTMRAILQAEGLPSDLVYLSMIESGFSPKAYSFAHAAGPWQFIRATGVRMGLTVNFWVDERRDPIKATYAAARYLRDLNHQFGDWWLAWASYNAGPAKVQRAIRRQRSREFFTLARGRYLRWETRNYVPKLIAAATISKDPAAYGFGDVEPMAPFDFDTLAVEDSLSLAAVGKACGADVEVLQELNPELRRAMTPPRAPGEPPYLLRVPRNGLAACRDGMARLGDEDRVRFRRHRVKPKETLASVAAIYGASTEAIVKENNLPNEKLRDGEDLIVPVPPGRPSPVGDLEDEVRERRGRVVRAAPPRGTKPVHVTVSKGDTLWDIAAAHGVDVRSVVAWNGLNRRHRLRVGQRLVIYVR